MLLETSSKLKGEGTEETLFLQTRPMLSSQWVHNGNVNRVRRYVVLYLHLQKVFNVTHIIKL